MKITTLSFHTNLFLAVVVFAFFIRFITAVNIGEMYDEVAVAGYGKIYIGAIKNLDFDASIWSINYEHPPMAKYIFGMAVAIEERLPFIQKTFDSMYHKDKGYFLAKIASGLIGIITIIAVYLITKKWFDEKVALFSIFFLSFMPHFIAHNSIAGIETPQVLFSLLFIYFYTEGVVKKKPKNIYIAFVFWALFFLTKFSAIFFLAYVPLLLVFDLVKRKKLDKAMLVASFIGSLLAILVVYLLWPWLWIDPFNIVKSFSFFKNSYSGEYILGKIQAPPVYYYVLYLIATTPPVIVIMMFLVVKLRLNQFKYLKFIVVWLLVTLLMSVLNLKKDGIRYVITALPPMAILAGLGFSTILNNLKSFRLKFVLVFIMLFSISYSLVSFYPHYLDYYNLFVGGTQTVYKYKLLDYGWWGEGIKQAIMYANDKYSGKSVYLQLKPAHVIPELNEDLERLDDGDIKSGKIPEVIVISENYFYHNRDIYLPENYRLVHTVEVNKLPLVKIYER